MHCKPGCVVVDSWHSDNVRLSLYIYVSDYLQGPVLALNHDFIPTPRAEEFHFLHRQPSKALLYTRGFVYVVPSGGEYVHGVGPLGVIQVSWSVLITPRLTNQPLL